MKHLNIKKRTLIEITSILGIMAFFYSMDRSFGLLEWLSNEVSMTFPGFKQYSLSVTVIGFIGLLTYSLMLRINGRREKMAREVLEEFLRKKEFTDDGTGLSNRLGFKLMLAELRNSEVMSRKTIIAFEIRNLDSISSVHNVNIATQIEKVYADHLVSLSREHDFAARAQKGRFYLIINAADKEEGAEQTSVVLDAIKRVSDDGLSINGMTMSTLLNIGILDLSEHKKQSDDWSEEDIIQRLDYMLYKSKSNPRKDVQIYSAEMEKSLCLRALVESELIDSLKNGQIQPFFQPFIDMKTNKVVGFEILARWNHPVQGAIPPDIFVHVADEIGAMYELTTTMLELACKKAQYWPEDITLSFNFSPHELRNNRTMDELFKILNVYDINTDRIEIEITENAFIEEVGEINEVVACLKKRGVQISIDDFGTGFANFTHLKMLPFDKIKIDKSFVRDMGSNPESEAIVRNIIALGKSMNLPTVAEGVELTENRDHLHELGCSVGQGYLYAKPLSGEDVLTFLKNYQSEIIYLDKVA